MKMDSHRRSVGPLTPPAAPLALRVDRRTLEKWPVLAASDGRGHVDAPNRTTGLATSDSIESCGSLPQSGMNRRSTQQPTKNRAIAARRRNQSTDPHPDRRLRGLDWESTRLKS